jgi:hypothetical protein
MKKPAQPIHPLLKRMSRIQRMERGKVCRMSGRPHYNHQTWQNGRNVVRYVPLDHVASLQEAVDGYRLFMQLAHQYADQVIQRTRRHLSRPAAPQKRSRAKNEDARKYSRIASENV